MFKFYFRGKLWIKSFAVDSVDPNFILRKKNKHSTRKKDLIFLSFVLLVEKSQDKRDMLLKHVQLVISVISTTVGMEIDKPGNGVVTVPIKN